MLSDDWVCVFNGFTSKDATPLCRLVIICLLESRVDGLQCAQEGNERGRKLPEGENLRTVEGIASCSGLGEEEESGEAGRLELVRYIRVPDGGCNAIVRLKGDGRTRISCSLSGC